MIETVITILVVALIFVIVLIGLSNIWLFFFDNDVEKKEVHEKNGQPVNRLLIALPYLILLLLAGGIYLLYFRA